MEANLECEIDPRLETLAFTGLPHPQAKIWDVEGDRILWDTILRSTIRAIVGREPTGQEMFTITYEFGMDKGRMGELSW